MAGRKKDWGNGDTLMKAYKLSFIRQILGI